jgi:hypothetical protein
MAQRCGRTFADTMRLYRDYYPADRPLPFLLIVTWNDYEEGTAEQRQHEQICQDVDDASSQNHKTEPLRRRTIWKFSA